jgi:general L-amino acid transport system permease protein
MTAATPSIRRRPDQRLGPVKWLRKNLFNTWYNAILTILALWIIYRLVTSLVRWLLQANWAPVTTSPILYAVGQYPLADLWRIGLCLWIVSFMFGMSWALWGNIIRNFAIMMALGFIVIGILLPFDLENVSRTILRIYFFSNVAVLLIGFGIGHTPLGKARWVLVGWILSLPIIVVLLHGIAGSERLPLVETTLWGGLMLNLLLAGVGIAASFPIGVLLALGRRSSLPVVKTFCTLFIELVRGVPLVGILFMASIILPLFLPEDVRIDRLVRALIGITLFSAAYVAENVRGGLQAIPLGQYDAAKAIGLNGTLTTLLIILPQALRLVIPAIVGQFIALFKDTTLVVIVGLIEILGIGKTILAGNPEWIGAQKEVYLFIAAVFWVFTYSMAYSSHRLEKLLGVGER